MRIASALVFTVCLAREVYMGVFPAPQPLGPIPLLDFNREMTLPAWYSGMLMVVCACLLLVHAALSRRLGEADRWHFTALAAIFAYLSFDEIVGIHELGLAFFGNVRAFGGIFRYSWTLIAIPVVIVVGLAFSHFLWRRPSPFGRRILVAGIVFVAGAIGMEMAGGHILTWRSPFAFRLAVIAEEGLEISGLTLFATALVDYLAARTSGLAIMLDRR